MAEQTAIESVLNESRLFPPPADFASQAEVASFDEYEKLYARAEADPENFGAEQADALHWFKRWEKVLEWNEPAINFYRKYGAKLDDEWTNCTLERNQIEELLLR